MHSRSRVRKNLDAKRKDTLVYNPAKIIIVIIIILAIIVFDRVGVPLLYVLLYSS